MNRPLSKHVAWLLITIGTFIAGSQLARRGSVSVRDSAEIEFRDRHLLSTENSPGSRGRTAKKPTDSGASLGPGSADGMSVVPVARIVNTATTPAKALPPLTEAQIEELAVTATKSSNPIERRKAFDRLLEEMQSETFTTQQAMMMRSALHENGASGGQWRAFDYAWGANDPDAALAYIDEIPERYRNGYTGNMLPGLASVEPQMAIDLVNTLEGRLNYHMTGRLIEGLVDYDVRYATDYVNQLAKDGNNAAPRYMQRLTSEVMSTAGFDAGVAWAEGLDGGQLQALALRSVAHEYTNKDPRAASNWAEQFVGQDQNSRLFGEVVREWGDVTAATEWVNSLEPSLAQRDALSAVYGFRGSQEPHEAVQDIIDMPESDDKNFAINGFISGLAHQDGEAAVTWAAQITSQGMREAAMIRAGTQFFRQDQQAATEWFNASGLPETAWNQVASPK